jgi:hypothetical protein
MKTGSKVLVPCNPGESPLALVSKMPELTGEDLIDDWKEVEIIRENCSNPEKFLYCYVMPLSEIWQAFLWTEQHRLPYLQAIENRATGSHWGQILPWREIANLPWQKLGKDEYIEGIHLSSCQYYFLEELDTHRCLPSAKQNFRLLSSFSENELSSIKVREGVHGVELASTLVEEQTPNTAWLILGQARYEDKTKADAIMAWSAFPGELTASIKHVQGFDGTLNSLLNSNLSIAVKGD